MALSRNAWIGIGALGFLGALAAIMPPTTPVGAERNAAARPAAIRPPAPPPAPVYPDATISDAPGTVPPRPSQPLPPPEPPVRETDQSRQNPEPEAETAEHVLTYEQLEAAYRDGYRWAARNEVEDRRECRRFGGSPAEEGCRAFVSDARRGYFDEPAEDQPFSF